MRSVIAVLSTFLVACTTLVLAQGNNNMRTHSISMPYIGKTCLNSKTKKDRT